MRILLWTLYFLSLVFIVSGAFNYGFSRFLLAVPFVVVANVLAVRLTKRKLLFVVTLLFSIAAAAVNLTLERNPLVFPILKGGYVEVRKDGYYESWPKYGLEGVYFQEEPCTPESHVACDGQTIVTPIKAGTRLKVTGVRMEYPDFGKSIVLITESGMTFSTENFYLAEDALTTNSPVESRLFSKFGILMMWPALPFMLRSIVLEPTH